MAAECVNHSAKRAGPASVSEITVLIAITQVTLCMHTVQLKTVGYCWTKFHCLHLLAASSAFRLKEKLARCGTDSRLFTTDVYAKFKVT